VVTLVGEGIVFMRSVTPFIPRRRGPSGSHFCGFSATYAYTVRPIEQPIRRGNTYGEASHEITFAQMCRAVCQQQLSFLSSVPITLSDLKRLDASDSIMLPRIPFDQQQSNSAQSPAWARACL